MELLQTLAATDPRSIRDLAQEIDREESAVTRDLKQLAEYGPVDFEENGNRRNPVLTTQYIAVKPVDLTGEGDNN